MPSLFLVLFQAASVHHYRTGTPDHCSDIGGHPANWALHLVRLLRMGIEILTTGDLQVWRHDADELLAIRNGAWTYEQLIAWSAEAQQQFGTKRMELEVEVKRSR